MSKRNSVFTGHLQKEKPDYKNKPLWPS